MEKLGLMLIFTMSLPCMSIEPHAVAHPPNSEDLRLGKEKVTKLRLYLQDFIGGNNRTVWEVARSNLTGTLPSLFGIVAVLDNPVTIGPEMESGEMGRMQGVIGLMDFREVSLTLLLNIVFTEGEYKGSTLCLLGRNPLGEETREVPIVGGTGAFRLARGHVVTRTYRKDEARVHNVYEYNFVVVHF